MISGSVTTASISCINHRMRGLWFDFSWSLAKHMQAKQRFSSRLLKSSKVVCSPLINELIVLGLQCLACWMSCSSLDDVTSLVSMFTHFL